MAFYTFVKNKQIQARDNDAMRITMLVLNLERITELRNESHQFGVSTLQSIDKIVQTEIGTKPNRSRIHETTLVYAVVGDFRSSSPALLQESLTSVVAGTTQVGERSVNLSVRVSAEYLDPSEDVEQFCQRLSSQRNRQIHEHTARETILNSRFASLQAELPLALQSGQFVFHYQPIVDTTSRILCGFEALVRWNHPEHGLLQPSVFLPALDASGLMPSLSSAAIETTIALLARWEKEDIPNIFISLNLTSYEILKMQFANDLERQLNASNVPPHRLRLEITEQTTLSNIDAISFAIADLRNRGIGTVLDDFGSGYSSVSFLRKVRPLGVKLDGDFVSEVVNDARSFGLMKALVDLLHYLEIDCTAVGIENEEELEMMRIAQVDYLQGFHLAQPVDSQAATTIANSGTERIRVPKRKRPLTASEGR